MSGLRRRALLCALTAAMLAGCSSVGVGLTIPIGPVGVTIGGSVPLPRSSDPPASAPSQ